MDRQGPPTDRDRPAAGRDPDGEDDPAPGRPDRTDRPRDPIEPEPVDPEHAAFVLLGALLTVAVLVGGL